MALNTIHYSKENSFMRQISQPRRTVTNDKGFTTSSEYRKPAAPKAYQLKMPYWLASQGKWDLPFEQQELDDLVKAMNIYDDNGKQITEAPLHNMNSAFWKVPRKGIPHCAMVLESGTATFDDETAYGKYVKKWFDSDRAFTTPNKKANKLFELYTVTSVGQENVREVKEQSDALKAAQAFMEMDTPKRKQILGAFGVQMTEPDEKVIEQQLWKKISTDKDVRFTAGGPTNLEYFLSIVSGTEEETELKYLVSIARVKGKILKKSYGYIYDGTKLGPTLNEVYSYLADAKNKKVRENIQKEIDIE